MNGIVFQGQEGIDLDQIGIKLFINVYVALSSRLTSPELSATNISGHTSVVFFTVLLSGSPTAHVESFSVELEHCRIGRPNIFFSD